MAAETDDVAYINQTIIFPNLMNMKYIILILYEINVDLT